MLPHNLSYTAATSQDGSSLEFFAAIAGRQCYIQDASGRGLCSRRPRFLVDWRLLVKERSRKFGLTLDILVLHVFFLSFWFRFLF